MMKMCLMGWRILTACAAILSASSIARADIIPFDLGENLDGLAIDGAASGALTVNGLTATLTANIGVLWATSNNFGINAPGGADEPDLLDADSGTSEFITITFDKPVTFTQLSLGLFSGTETVDLTLGLNPVVTRTATSAATDVYDFSSDSFPMGNMLTAGQSLIVGHGTGNGFSLEGFQVNTVPEPSSLSLALPALIAGLLRRKRKL
jgi:hypothetical protein